MSRGAREAWVQSVAQWRASGLTAREFASRTGLSPNTLTHWKWKLGSESKLPRGKEAPGIGFVELRSVAEPAQSSDGRFEVILGSGLKVLVPAGFDKAELGRLLDTLRHD